MVSHSLVVGYHGCDDAVARKVISLKESLLPSQNPWDWLGHGFYFWEDSPARAVQWAEAESIMVKFIHDLGPVVLAGPVGESSFSNCAILGRALWSFLGRARVSW